MSVTLVLGLIQILDIKLRSTAGHYKRFEVLQNWCCFLDLGLKLLGTKFAPFNSLLDGVKGKAFIKVKFKKWTHKNIINPSRLYVTKLIKMV